MRRWRKSARAALGAAVLVMAAGTAARAAPCDQNDPRSPARTIQVTLGASDFTDDARDDMRSFIETGSLGKVTARLVAASPRGIVRTFSAGPDTNRMSLRYGEALEGIDIHVVLNHSAPAATVWLSVSQVCAQYFRNSFLY